MSEVGAIAKPLKSLAGILIGIVQMLIGLIFWFFQMLLEIPLHFIYWLQVHFPAPNHVWNYYCRSEAQDVEHGAGISAVGITAAAPIAGPSSTMQQPVNYNVHVSTEETAQRMVPVSAEHASPEHIAPTIPASKPSAAIPPAAPIRDSGEVPSAEPSSGTSGSIPVRLDSEEYNNSANVVDAFPTDVDHTYDSSGRQEIPDENVNVDSLLPPPVKTVPMVQEESDIVVEVDRPV